MGKRQDLTPVLLGRTNRRLHLAQRFLRTSPNASPAAVLQQKRKSLLDNHVAQQKSFGSSILQRLAFTLGSQYLLRAGQYDPHSVRGQQVLGHELTHVVQQRAGRVRNPQGFGIAVVQDHALEAEADRLGMRAAARRCRREAGR